MRPVIVFATLMSLAACNDGDRPTSPRSTPDGASHSVAASDVERSAAGKPTDQVGFTKITVVYSPLVPVPAGGSNVTVTATCPAGTQISGGGYVLTGNALATPGWIYYNDADGNAWVIRAANRLPGAQDFSIKASAHCLS